MGRYSMTGSIAGYHFNNFSDAEKCKNEINSTCYYDSALVASDCNCVFIMDRCDNKSKARQICEKYGGKED